MNNDKKIEMLNKKFLFYEKVIGYMSTINFLVIIFVTSYFVKDPTAITILYILAFITLIVGISFALKIETETGYYKCGKCNHLYVPKYSSVYMAMHYGTTRYLKCPKCNKKSWNKKVYKEK